MYRSGREGPEPIQCRTKVHPEKGPGEMEEEGYQIKAENDKGGRPELFQGHPGLSPDAGYRPDEPGKGEGPG